jgi:hypothetical protein
VTPVSGWAFRAKVGAVIQEAVGNHRVWFNGDVEVP